MTYRELQLQLKAYRSEGFSGDALNSKKEVLEAALNEIETGIIESGETSYHEMLSDNRTIEALEALTALAAIANDLAAENDDYVPDWETESRALAVDAQNQPVERAWKLGMMSLAKLRRYAKKAGIKHANQLKKQALIQALTA